MGRNFAVILDIDGVLYHAEQGRSASVTPIPGAAEVLDRLKSDGIDHFFLTNGTGYTDAGKAEQLSKLFDRQLDVGHFVLPTTPMKELVAEYGDKKVLVIAKTSEQGHEIAKSIGFRNVTTAHEYAARNPILCPCKRYPELSQQHLEDEEAIEAVFLFEVPADWYESAQICVDILRTSTGKPGRSHELGPDQKQCIPVFSGNPDLEYASKHSVPRFTLGAFRKCLECLYEHSTGRVLEVALMGKPYPTVYKYIERIAEEHMQHMKKETGPTHFYMIGDNPKSDIAGALGAGWQAILVRTGVYSGGPNEAHLVTDNVLTALQYIYKQEGLSW
jgi:HAD superfamily hydrolase (TIGR01456 family)